MLTPTFQSGLETMEQQVKTKKIRKNIAREFLHNGGSNVFFPIKSLYILNMFQSNSSIKSDDSKHLELNDVRTKNVP